MTIKQAANAYNVTPQAIYRRLKKAGKDVSTIIVGGNLTAEGEALLSSWFTNSDSNMVDLKLQLEKLTAENQLLKNQLENAAADKERLYQLLNQAQQTAAMALQKRSFFRALIGKREG